MKKKILCGKVIAHFDPILLSENRTDIHCNRKFGHHGDCDLIVLDMAQHPTRRVLLSNIPRRKKAGYYA